MAEDHIRYDILAQDALRGVLRKVLSEVARTGFPGEHHLYINFATQAPGVRVSSRLLAAYPEDMTIVLQHRFWDLIVTEHAFEVELTFNNVPERLIVPFTAVKGFSDPSVPFGVQFEIMARATRPQPVAPAAAVTGEEAIEPDGEAASEAEPEALADEAVADKEPGAGYGTPLPAKPANEGQVVSLDAFRKKS
jgi:hypothetical protein